jgi:hypothetical protein
MVEVLSKHFDSFCIHRKKSISLLVASIEIESLIPFEINGINPVETFVW